MEEKSVSRATRMRYLVLAVACSVAVLVYIQRVGFASALKHMSEPLGLTDFQVSWLTAAFLIAYGAFEIPWGLIGDKFGVRHPLTLIIIGSSITTGLAALAGHLPAVITPFVFLILVRFVNGLAQAGIFPSISRMMTDWMTTKERASAQGFIWMATRFGGLVAAPLLGWLIIHIGDWQTPLWLLAGLGFLWCVFFWPWFRNRPEQMKQVNEAERELIVAGRAPDSGHHDVPWGKMLRSRSVWALCFLYGFGGFAANFYVTLLPKYLKTHRELPDNVSDWLSSLPFAFGMISCLAGGLFSDWLIRRTGNRKWGRRLNGSIGMLIGAGGWLLISQVQSPIALGAVLCLIFFANDLAMAPAWASCADIGERYAGTLGGAMNMIGNIFGAAGNIVAGSLFGKQFQILDFTIMGNDLLFVIYACSFVCAALCWQGVDVTKKLR